MAVGIRRAAHDEIDTLRAIDVAARLRYASLPNFEFAAKTPAIAAERFSMGDTFVAELNAVPVGFALAQTLDGMAYLANISVLPQSRGQGIGETLLQHVIAYAVDARRAAVVLATFRIPPWNGPWFRKHGFETMSVQSIGPERRSVLDRHSSFLDMSTR